METAYNIKNIALNEENYAKISANVKNFAKPDAAEKIAETLMANGQYSKS